MVTDLNDLKAFNSQKSRYVKVEDICLDDTSSRRVIYVRKERLVLLYMERITKLSSDRTRRVKQHSQCIKMGEEHENDIDANDELMSHRNHLYIKCIM